MHGHISAPLSRASLLLLLLLLLLPPPPRIGQRLSKREIAEPRPDQARKAQINDSLPDTIGGGSGWWPPFAGYFFPRNAAIERADDLFSPPRLSPERSRACQNGWWLVAGKLSLAGGRRSPRGEFRSVVAQRPRARGGGINASRPPTGG